MSHFGERPEHGHEAIQAHYTCMMAVASYPCSVLDIITHTKCKSLTVSVPETETEGHFLEL